MSLPTSSVTSGRLLFRVDGSTITGLGHLVRCQALAQALQPALAATFIIREPAPTIAQQLTAVGITVQTVPADVPPGLSEAEWLANQVSATDILVLDGYHFGPAYQRRLAATGAALVCLDDLITAPTWADVVLNQAGGVAPVAYSQVPLARLCPGPAYALLRPAFWQPAPALPDDAPRRLFLNMGGADPGNQTLALLPQLRRQFSAYQVAVVTGAAYPHLAALQAATAADAQVILRNNLSATDLAALLRTCQVFVCPPSGVAYECCAAGGAVLLHPTADNQRALFEFLTRQELALPLAAGLALSEAELPALAARQRPRQRALFDGRAGERLQSIFGELAASQQYILRRATAADAALYFGWANDPAVRQYAIHPEPIAWETHVAWFRRRLQDADSYLYILSTAGGEPVGQVRVEFDGPDSPGLIDYSVAAAHRGRGLGAVLLRRALQRLRHDRPRLAGGAVLGQVQAGNVASARVFEGLRFVRQAAVTLRGEAYEVFRLDFPLDFALDF
ncbi:UDP-2,4-diacetamido-2,4,6-trideoxy-beta-L-altropyranose hydrolase [Hymenobacter sp. H14-R3]|uniref:UDP-2,4-diacetamido-2,4, 6-trideoxy-beta-L-altropyranose hydrolase n=1 Tax=Hymenobacter sp. H14-R3 TaxID=3046308 RepID=UPI0024B94C9C|nr:UDP-2,4-diacetamido-2,4,6-trideoxy-beta-L-altropyranose hydrolase [Hymenobacter sp. H14-R3]MDJ0363924.1 UDP-2,4-diacetamido-2,4,6-trideoxy-beta-L-altropyranose hydrolase [Hymenobacter sp. H14-R3]